MSVTLIPPPFSTRDILSSLSRLADNPAYHDLSLVCRDGVVPWSRFLISANSAFLSACLKDTFFSTEGDTSTVIVPDISSATLSTLLRCTLNHAVRRDILSVNEQQVMSMLGFSLMQQRRRDVIVDSNFAPNVVRAFSVQLDSPMQHGFAAKDDDNDNSVGNSDDDFENASVFSDIPILTQDIDRDVDSISMISMDARIDGCCEPIMSMVALDDKMQGESISMGAGSHVDSMSMEARSVEDFNSMGASSQLNPISMGTMEHFDPMPNTMRSQDESISVDARSHFNSAPLIMRTPMDVKNLESIDTGKEDKPNPMTSNFHMDLHVNDDLGMSASIDDGSDDVGTPISVNYVESVLSMGARNDEDFFVKNISEEDEEIVHASKAEKQKISIDCRDNDTSKKNLDDGMPAHSEFPSSNAIKNDSVPTENTSSIKESKSEPSLKPKFKCSDCGQVFVRALHLLQHAANHKRDHSFVCDLCGKIFFHESHLQSHKRYHQDIAKEISCSQCDKSFKGKRALNNHVGLVHEFLKCAHCEQEIPKARMRKHLKRVHEKGAKFRRDDFSCNVCQKRFQTSRSLMVHKRTHEGSNSDGYMRCSICRKLFACRDHLSIHMQKQHVEIECDVCGKMVRNIRVHQKNVHSPGFSDQNIRTKCSDIKCEKEFSTAYAAKYHYARVHSKARVIKKRLCKVCDKSYLDLKRHEREVHSENRFECRTCGNFFPVRQSLDRHVQNVHHPSKVACPYCEKDLLHLPVHLVGAHGMAEKAARDLADGLTGRAAARTDLQWVMTEGISQKTE